MTYLEQLFSLDGKIAVVTGGSRGLGRAISEALLRAGATTILVGADAERLAEARETFADQGLKAFAHQCDLADPTQIERLHAFVSDQWGRLDILVNNAGTTASHCLSEYPDEAWDRTLRVDLEAPFRLIRAFAAMMRDQGDGSIVNITSIVAELGAPDNPAYAAAKGGLKQLTKALALDLGPHGIRVNNVGPGYFRTDMTRYSWDDPQRRAERAQRTVLGRWGQPDDLAGLVVLLASDASRYITGQDLYVDGGWLAKL